MDPIATTAIIGVALTIFVPMLMRLPSEQKRYQKMDDRKLIDTRVNARMMRGVMLAIAFLGPIPLSFVFGMIKNPTVSTVFICVMIATVMCGVMGFWIFFEIIRQVTTELETRELEQKKNTEPAN